MKQQFMVERAENRNDMKVTAMLVGTLHRPCLYKKSRQLLMRAG